jgi:CBS domain-containing protein
MKVKEIMTPNIEFVSANDTIKKAAEKMKTLNVGAMPVGAEDEAVGIITDRDIVIRSTARGLDPEKHKVMEAVTEHPVTADEEDDINTIVDLMEKNQIRRVIIKDREGKVTGIVSLGDLAVHLQKELAGEVLEKISEPSKPAR